MALVSPSPPPSASLYPPAGAIYSHSPTAEVRAPLVAAPKVGASNGTRPASVASRECTSSDSARHEATGGKATTVDDLAASTGALGLTEGLERQHASANTDETSATFQPPAHKYTATDVHNPNQQGTSTRSGPAAAASTRTGVRSGFQSRSAATPVASNRHSPAPSSSSLRSTSSSSVQYVANGYSASSSSAASSSTSFVPASTPAMTPLTPTACPAPGVSPSVSTSPQSYFAVAPTDQQRYPNSQFPNPMLHHPGQPYPPHSSGFPNPAFPFLPSPHPGVPHMTAFGGTQLGVPSPQQNQDQHALFLQYQHQWQMEMLRNQQFQTTTHPNDGACIVLGS